jgi:hypothetical protein
MIPKENLVEVVEHIKTIAASYDDGPIALTVGYTPETDCWDWQTGDNSYMGNAYFHPLWAVLEVDTDDDTDELINDIIEQLEELTSENT